MCAAAIVRGSGCGRGHARSRAAASAGATPSAAAATAARQAQAQLLGDLRVIRLVDVVEDAAARHLHLRQAQVDGHRFRDVQEAPVRRHGQGEAIQRLEWEGLRLAYRHDGEPFDTLTCSMWVP